MGILDSISTGQIVSIITILAGLVGSVIYLRNAMKTWVIGAITPELTGIKDEMNKINNRLEDVDIESCKNYLVMMISKIEQGTELDEVEKERFYEQYEHYLKLGGNTYIQVTVEKLQKKNLI